MICRHCEEEFTLRNGKPGLIDECPDCAVEVPVYRAEAEDSTGSSCGMLKTTALDVRTLHSRNAAYMGSVLSLSSRESHTPAEMRYEISVEAKVA